MLDIRFLAGLCTEKNLQLKCLGFDEEARNRTSDTEMNISRNEVSNAIEVNSILVADNIAVLKSKTSLGFRRVEDTGPFDVINLDLCGSFSCINHPDNHQVLTNLCWYQVNKRREPWLLFLTTRAEYKLVNIEHLCRYLTNLKANAESYSSFGNQLFDMTGFNVSTYDEANDTTGLFESYDGKHFVKLFAVGFGKWLLKLIQGNGISWTVEMLDSCWYRVEDNQFRDSFPNMLSLAFRFSPIDVSLEDESGLAEGTSMLEVDEEGFAMGILEKTNNFADLDKKLDEDEFLYTQLEEESAILLETARYSVDQYHEWAEGKRIRFAEN